MSCQEKSRSGAKFNWGEKVREPQQADTQSQSEPSGAGFVSFLYFIAPLTGGSAGLMKPIIPKY
jgi:hypothetical protein